MPSSRLKRVFRFLLPALLVIAAIFAVGVMSSLKEPPEKKEQPDLAMLVEAVEADQKLTRFTVTSQGTVKPRTETILVSEVSGKITGVSPKFVAGGFFRTGEVLLQIDPSDYQTALKRTQANLASRRAQLAQEQARSEQALKDWNNLGGNRGEPNDLVLRKPQLAEAQANVRAAEADLQKARRDLERTKIRVPYAGLVKEKRADIGQYVTLGTQLGVTFAIDSAEIRLPLTDADLAYIDLPSATGDDTKEPSTVYLSANVNGQLQEWSAQIIRSEGVVDESTRQVYAVAQVVDPYGVLGQSQQTPLKVGTFVKAEIQGLTGGQLTVLPRHALRPNNQVLVATTDGLLEVRNVSVIRATPESAYISAGLEDGERIITTAIEAPIPGTSIRIRGDEQDGDSSDISDLVPENDQQLATTGDS